MLRISSFLLVFVVFVFINNAEEITKSKIKIDGRDWCFQDFESIQKQSCFTYDTNSGKVTMPYHGNSHHGTLIYSCEPIEGNFVFSLRLLDMNRCGDWVFVHLTIHNKPFTAPREDGTDCVNILWRAQDVEGKKSGMFIIPTGKISGGLTMISNINPVQNENYTQKGTMPFWMRMEKKGTVFTGFISQTGEKGTWQKIGSVTKGGLGGKVYVGVYMSSAHSPVVNKLTYEKMTFNEDVVAAYPRIYYTANTNVKASQNISTITIHSNQLNKNLLVNNSCSIFNLIGQFHCSFPSDIAPSIRIITHKK